MIAQPVETAIRVRRHIGDDSVTIELSDDDALSSGILSIIILSTSV